MHGSAVLGRFLRMGRLGGASPPVSWTLGSRIVLAGLSLDGMTTKCRMAWPSGPTVETTDEWWWSDVVPTGFKEVAKGCGSGRRGREPALGRVVSRPGGSDGTGGLSFGVSNLGDESVLSDENDLIGESFDVGASVLSLVFAGGVNGRVIRASREAARTRVLLDLTDSGLLGIVMTGSNTGEGRSKLSGEIPCPLDPGRDLDFAPIFCRNPVILPPLLELDIPVAEGGCTASTPAHPLVTSDSDRALAVRGALFGDASERKDAFMVGGGPVTSRCRCSPRPIWAGELSLRIRRSALGVDL